MTSRILRGLHGHVQRALLQVNWLLPKDSRDMVFFYTFHKCASTFFSNQVLRNIEGLRRVDCASRAYGEWRQADCFSNTTALYTALCASGSTRCYWTSTRLVSRVDIPEFVQHKIAIFPLCDPRDIFIAAYYQLG